MQAIRAQGPFTNPGGTEEQNLLLAIRRVGAVVATVEAANALMGAVRGLIAAYSAAGTEG
jgi:hypothetical protein